MMRPGNRYEYEWGLLWAKEFPDKIASLGNLEKCDILLAYYIAKPECLRRLLSCLPKSEQILMRIERLIEWFPPYGKDPCGVDFMLLDGYVASTDEDLRSLVLETLQTSSSITGLDSTSSKVNIHRVDHPWAVFHDSRRAGRVYGELSSYIYDRLDDSWASRGDEVNVAAREFLRPAAYLLGAASELAHFVLWAFMEDDFEIADPFEHIMQLARRRAYSAISTDNSVTVYAPSA